MCFLACHGADGAFLALREERLSSKTTIAPRFLIHSSRSPSSTDQRGIVRQSDVVPTMVIHPEPYLM
jgi:hypothetical protein